jgi:transposase InsO family protein
MLVEDKMRVDERRKYLALMKRRYELAGRRERGQLLDEMEKVTDMHRKALVRLLNASDLSRKPRRKQRGGKYGAMVRDAIRVIAESLDYVCAERLKPALPTMARHLTKMGEMRASPELIAQLEEISIASVGRVLRRLGQDTYRLPRKGPERASQLAREIPMGRLPWDEKQPGHFEVDTVHHCGAATVGEYVHTVQMVDVATGWSERIATMGRGQRDMEIGFKRIRIRLPMPVIQLHIDNGSEFLNNHFVRCWKEAANGLKLMRSRPYQKNDNRMVEQKNSTLVRAYVGDERLDTSLQCEKLNELYDKMWLYYNFFQPVMRLKEKQALVQADGTYKVKHRYDIAQTPFERLCATEAISQETKVKLTALRDRTNPRQLRREIYHLLDELLNMADKKAIDNETLTVTNETLKAC